MLRPLLAPLLFLALAVAIGVGLQAVRTSLAPPQDLDMERLRMERLLHYAKRIEALSVGNSHSLAVDFDVMDVAGYHVWSRGQDVFEVEAQLRDLLPELPNLETVLMTVSFGSFLRDNGASTDEDRGMVRSVWYSTTRTPRMIGVDLENYAKGLMQRGIVSPDHWRSVFDELARRARGIERPRRQYMNLLGAAGQAIVVPPMNKRRATTHEYLVTDAEQIVIPRHARLQANMLENNPDMEADTYAAMQRIIALLEEAGIRAIFYTPPYYKTYTDGVVDETKRSMRENMARLVAEHGIEYHDFSQDPLFAGKPGAFVNCDHMGLEGSREFSAKRLKPLLKRKKEKQKP
jgi:hypothetical protein